jgi:hypothetical protein
MTTTNASLAAPQKSVGSNRIDRLRALALRGLARMYRPDERLFAFRLRRTIEGTRLEGSSIRYTAIVAIGLANEPESTVREVLRGDHLTHVTSRLLRPGDIADTTNLGDIALVYWAARSAEDPRADAALAQLGKLLNQTEQHETVGLAWALAALCDGAEAGQAAELRDEALRRLTQAYRDRSQLFAHQTGSNRIGLRGHVACFADLVYPIYALARYHVVTSDLESLRLANRLCSLLGTAGQWWWHYDVRTGRILERYPVYAVHQDAMAPMALFALTEAGGRDHSEAIAKGLAWLESAPELDGGSLIDESAGVIWRKVARREPRKFVRRAQAVAARIHPTLRWPGMNVLFPAEVIDDECRPYHLGWLLYAWPEYRATRVSIKEDTAHAATP